MMKIAIQGEFGSFSHEAALQMMPEATVIPCALSAQVFSAVESGAADAAVIPIENSLAGPVAEHYDLLLSHQLRIEREALVRIRHNLIALPGVELAQVERACSHPIALAQCRGFFAAHPAIAVTPFYDTAGSVKHIVEQQDRRSAAIASTEAARCYGATILAAGIEDNPENYTRFFFLRRNELVAENPRADKVSLAFSVENRPGTLVAALQIFADQGTNLTKIESRPVQGRPWEYIFYADFQMENAAGARAALVALEEHCSMIKELGRYSAASREK